MSHPLVLAIVLAIALVLVSTLVETDLDLEVDYTDSLQINTISNAYSSPQHLMKLMTQVLTPIRLYMNRPRRKKKPYLGVKHQPPKKIITTKPYIGRKHRAKGWVTVEEKVTVNTQDTDIVQIEQIDKKEEKVNSNIDQKTQI